MEIITNKQNGQTISLPFELVDFNIHGQNHILVFLQDFCDRFMSSQSFNSLVEGYDDEAEMLENIDDIMRDLEYRLNQLNLDEDIIIDLDNFSYTIMLQEG